MYIQSYISIYIYIHIHSIHMCIYISYKLNGIPLGQPPGDSCITLCISGDVSSSHVVVRLTILAFLQSSLALYFMRLRNGIAKTAVVEGAVAAFFFAATLATVVLCLFAPMVAVLQGCGGAPTYSVEARAC